MKTTGKLLTARRHSGYTLVEVMVAAVVMGIMFVSLYAAFSAGFAVVRASREKSRATQILLQKLEVMRFCTWNQFGSFPKTFREPYDPQTTNSAQNAFYFGTVSFNSPAMIPDTVPYKTNIQQVTVSVRWTNYDGSVAKPQVEQMTTIVARYGAQNLALGK